MARKSGWFHAFSGYVAILFVKFCGALPLPLARTLGRCTGWIIYCVPRAHRIALANLDLAYKDTLSPAEKRRIARASMMNMGIVAAEFGHLEHLNEARVSRLVRFEGFEHIDPERGALIIGAHLGNWELMAPVVAQRFRPVAEVVRPLDHPALNALVDRIRTGAGAATITKDNAGREIMRRLKEGWLVGVLIDQSPRVSAVPVTFFNEPCWATVAPAMIALRMNVPIHGVTMNRDADGRYCVRFTPAIPLAKSGDFRGDLVRITQEAQNSIEATIRAYPEQWLWAHRRWKTRPNLEAEWRAKEARADAACSDEIRPVS